MIFIVLKQKCPLRYAYSRVLSLVKQSCVVGEVESNHPLLKVIPCSMEHLCQNMIVPYRFGNELNDLLADRYDAVESVVTSSCRKALRMILDVIDIRSVEDEVAVFTTSGRPYLSGCVSRAIGERGAWIRESVTEKTKAIIVIHEFGYPYEGIQELKHYGLPIIEDAAFAFDTRSADGKLVGAQGDYLVCSFSKFFDIQIGGGALRINQDAPSLHEESSESDVGYVKGVVLSQFNLIEQHSRTRIRLLKYYCEKFEEIGVKSYFNFNEGVVPGVFLFRPEDGWDLPALKSYLWTRGVQCTVFYGDYGFYLPLHHNMDERVVDYLYVLIRNYLDEA